MISNQQMIYFKHNYLSGIQHHPKIKKVYDELALCDIGLIQGIFSNFGILILFVIIH